jgi:hypothetical protein
MSEIVRKPISNSIRFEVFKRDAFTCQYCGAKAPEVILNVDHINAVVSGGSNEIINLITSCFNCNSGKGARALNDTAIIEKQRKQIEELNERRTQLELLMAWRASLENIETETIDIICTAISKHSKFRPSDAGRKHISKWLKKFSAAELLDALDICFLQYLKPDDDPKTLMGSWERAFCMTPRVAAINKNGGISADKSTAFYVRGILRNRLNYLNERTVINICVAAFEAGVTHEDVKHAAKKCKNWTDFTSWLSDMEATA